MASQSVLSRPIVEAARNLAEAIQSDSRWVGWREAAIAAEQDPELRQMMIRFRELSRLAQRSHQAGQPLTGSQIMELATVQNNIQQSEAYIRRDEATTSLIELLQQVNEVLSALLDIDFAAAAAPRGGCCG